MTVIFCFVLFLKERNFKLIQFFKFYFDLFFYKQIVKISHT